MLGHKALALTTNLDVYLCGPHSPWQRGSIENFIAKSGRDIMKVTQEIYVFGAPTCNEFICNTATVDAQNSYTLERRVLNIRFGAPGTIIADWKQ